MYDLLFAWTHLQEEKLKGDIVSMALEIRSGTSVSSIDIIPLVRKAVVLGWRSDPSMSGYIQVLAVTTTIISRRFPLVISSSKMFPISPISIS